MLICSDGSTTSTHGSMSDNSNNCQKGRPAVTCPCVAKPWRMARQTERIIKGADGGAPIVVPRVDKIQDSLMKEHSQGPSK